MDRAAALAAPQDSWSMLPAEPPVVVVAPPPPEPARDAERDPEREATAATTARSGAVEVSLGSVVFFPDLAQVKFEGSGVPGHGTTRRPFSHRGRELGLKSPLVWGGALELHYVRRSFAVGAMGYLAAHPGPADAAPDPPGSAASAEVDQPGMLAYGFGLDVAGALPLGDHVSVRVGPMSGVRVYSLPMTGFEPKTCHTRSRGEINCWEHATAVHLFLEPRARVEITPGSSGVVLGAYAGADVIGGGFAGGVFLGYRFPGRRTP